MSDNEKQALDKALKLVPIKWHKDFLEFMETGEGSNEFLNFLEFNSDCRLACEIILRADETIKNIIREVIQDLIIETFNGD